MVTSDIDVVYIGGTGRSGSTLLLRLLGALDECFSTGELRHIWTHHFVMNYPCGCGNDVRDCEFWNAVMDDAFGGMDHLDPRYMISLQRSLLRGRHYPLFAFPDLRPEHFSQQLREYTSILASLYRSIQRVSGCEIIVDSSKHPLYALALSETPGVRLKVLHLMRDSRAYAYSLQRKKPRMEIPGRESYMNRPGSLRAALSWNINKLTMPLVIRKSTDYITYRYEDFTATPQQVLLEMSCWLNIRNPSALPFESDTSVTLGPDHALFGNPNRFEHGAVNIQPDHEWRRHLAWSQKTSVTALTLPFLWKYGYLGHNQSRPNESMAIEPNH